MLKIKSNSKVKSSYLLGTLNPGTLVKPKKKIYLTPIHGDHEVDDWLEWSPSQVGVVIPSEDKIVGICVLISSGCGLCFYDEVFVLSK